MSLLDIFKRSTKRSTKAERVFSYSDLRFRISSNSWTTVNNIDNKPELIDKVLYHLKTATDYRAYVTSPYVECSCYTKKFGYIKCSFRHNFTFFEFGIYKSGTRYDIPYAIKDNEEFKDFLQRKFGDLIKEYEEDRNL